MKKYKGGLVYGRVPEAQDRFVEYCIWQKWMLELLNDGHYRAEYEWGNEEIQRQLVLGVQQERMARSPERAARLAGCDQCREFQEAGAGVYPAHDARVKGHPEHCSCGRCF